MAKKYRKITQPWELLLISNDFRQDLSILFDGALVINQIEARAVLSIFKLYKTHGNLRAVQRILADTNIRSKRRVFASGRIQGGSVLSRGQIHFLLTNPIYIGKIRHKDKIYPGLQEAIIEQELWGSVQGRLQEASNRSRAVSNSGGNSRNTTTSSSLAGIFRDETGDRLTPTHTKRRGKRIRYYVSNRLISGRKCESESGWRLPAIEFEQSVLNIVSKHFENCANRQQILTAPNAEDAIIVARKTQKLATSLKLANSNELKTLITSGNITPGRISIELGANALANILARQADEISSKILSVTAPFQLRKRGVEIRIVAGEYQRAPDQVLLRTLSKARHWVREHKKGNSLIAIASRDAHSDAYIRMRCQLAFLSPKIQEAIVNGTQPVDLTVERIIRTGVPLDWAEQWKVFGFEN